MHIVDGRRLIFLFECYKRAMAGTEAYEDMFYCCELTGYVQGVIDSSPVLQSHITWDINTLGIVDSVAQYVMQCDDLSKPAVDIIHAAILKSKP